MTLTLYLNCNVFTSVWFLQFFTTEPYACEPSSLPKYPPSKELDVKLRDEEARRFHYSFLCFVSSGPDFVSVLMLVVVFVPFSGKRL